MSRNDKFKDQRVVSSSPLRLLEKPQESGSTAHNNKKFEKSQSQTKQPSIHLLLLFWWSIPLVPLLTDTHDTSRSVRSQRLRLVSAEEYINTILCVFFFVLLKKLLD